MQQSINSQYLKSEQSSSCRSYLVKKKRMQLIRSKEARSYFQTPKYSQKKDSSIDKNLSTISVDYNNSYFPNQNDVQHKQSSMENSLISTIQHSQLEQTYQNNKFNTKNKQQTQYKTDKKQNLTQSLISTLNQKTTKNKNLLLSTLQLIKTKKQILISDPSINPQFQTIFPKISKNATQKHKTQISQRLQKFNLYRNNSTISENDPYHIISKEIADKFSMQKLNNYKKLWQKKEKKRKKINSTLKSNELYKSFSFNASILDKSLQKSKDITVNYNKDIERRKQKCYWQQELRGNRKRYVTLGQTSDEIRGLKGYGQNLVKNIVVKPTFTLGKNNFWCEQVYKHHK